MDCDWSIYASANVGLSVLVSTSGHQTGGYRHALCCYAAAGREQRHQDCNGEDSPPITSPRPSLSRPLAPAYHVPSPQPIMSPRAHLSRLLAPAYHVPSLVSEIPGSLRKPLYPGNVNCPL
eukprot:1196109-Prorocentrum_minimum.AAC.1